MPKMIFLNLPVKDLVKAIGFYEAIGCSKNAQFSNDEAACMVWSETITFMLLTPAFYTKFTDTPIGDAHAASAMLIALSFDSRTDVDTVTEAAGGAGGKANIREPQDHGFMYQRTFEDPDGNMFEPMWMDPDAKA